MRARVRRHTHLLGRRYARSIIAPGGHDVDLPERRRNTYVRAQGRRLSRMLGRERIRPDDPSGRQNVHRHRCRVHPHVRAGERRHARLLGRRREGAIVAARRLDFHRDNRRRDSHLRPYFHWRRRLLGRCGQRPRPSITPGGRHVHSHQCGLSPHLRDQGRWLRSLLGVGQREPGVQRSHGSDIRVAFMRTAALLCADIRRNTRLLG